MPAICFHEISDRRNFVCSPEHTDISGAMARRQLKDRSPVCVQRIDRHD
jgi:hypothetical protein